MHSSLAEDVACGGIKGKRKRVGAKGETEDGAYGRAINSVEPACQRSHHALIIAYRLSFLFFSP